MEMPLSGSRPRKPLIEDKFDTKIFFISILIYIRRLIALLERVRMLIVDKPYVPPTQLVATGTLRKWYCRRA